MNGRETIFSILNYYNENKIDEEEIINSVKNITGLRPKFCSYTRRSR